MKSIGAFWGGMRMAWIYYFRVDEDALYLFQNSENRTRMSEC